MHVAVVGSGVAGLGAAYVLSRAHQVTVFEREQHPGGHVNTVRVDGLALDTGFIVHNEPNYPLLCRLFEELGIRTQQSDMSFSVSCHDCGLEYAGCRVFAQRRNVVSGTFHVLLWEIGRWLRTARASLEELDLEGWSLGRYLDERGYSQRFRRHFLVPLTSALWSTAPGRALEYPAAAAIRFFDNHGMLGFGRFRWRTVVGGSRTYVDAIGERIGGVRTGLPVRSLRREDAGVVIRTDDGEEHRFDAAVVATHADQALGLLERPTDEERQLLGTFTYTVNDAVLHTDESFLPATRAARASWNYRVNGSHRPAVTYWLNSLQALEADRDYLVTLNQEIADEHVHGRFRYTHPLFTVETHAAQGRLPGLSLPPLAFAGAYHGNGFHEDGLALGRARRGGAGGALVRSALYEGTLVHVRHEPREHAFRYPVAYWLLDLDELPELERRFRSIGVNRRALFSLRDRDHFDGDGTALKEAVVRTAGDPSIQRVLVLTQLRVLGYVFNPVSFYWCYRADGSLACMVAELSNTFGERLPEVLPGASLELRARQAPARLPLHGPRAAVPLPLLRAQRERVRPHRGARGRAPGAPRRPRLPATRADQPRARPLLPALPAHACAGDRADPLAGAQALGQAHPVPPQAAVRAREGIGANVSVAIRRPPAARVPLVDRAAAAVLGRVLHGLEGGTLEVGLPDGRQLSFGAGPSVRMDIHDLRLLRRLATRPKLGLGESYQAGEWSSDDLPALITLLARNAERGRALHPNWQRFVDARPRLNRRTGLLAARRNIRYHYDLGNELFALFLDETMTYSCAVWECAGEPLADAQRRKLRRVCETLELGPGDHLLEIGCGWGSLALTAAGDYGARVTGITLSQAQAEVARQRVREAGLSDRVEIAVRDFREVDGTYTAVASIEMVEAIGERLFATYFAAIDRVLAAGGRALVQSILVPDARYPRYRASPDWIERYVFPGCLIPSLGVLAASAGRLHFERVDEIGHHYAATLAAWRERFLARLVGVRALGYDERFIRTWDFYLAGCEALFRAGLLRDAQLLIAR